MNNKGFTLIELLAVIVILLGISLAAVSAISSSLERREARECEEQKELAKNAAKIYFSLNDSVDPQTGVTIETLKNGYFKEISKINRLDNTSIVKIVDNKYTYVGECTES